MIEKTIAYSEAGQRADKYVRKVLNDAPLSFVYKLFRKKDVKINGKPIKIDYKINTGEVMRIYVTDQQLEDFVNPDSIEGRDFPFSIIYEDDNILIVNKPVNILVHSDESSGSKKTLTDYVLSYLVYKNEYNPRLDLGFKPSPVHRLDRNTTGLVLFGKNIETLQQLNKLFQDKTHIEKFYLALVVGVIKKDGEVHQKLLKDEKHNKSVVSNEKYAKDALTKYWVKRVFDDATLLRLQIITGRTHQIRVHMQFIEHPVINDGKYGNFDFNRQFEKTFHNEDIFLHAHTFRFKSLPGHLAYLSNQEFVAELPEDKITILNTLKKEM